MLNTDCSLQLFRSVNTGAFFFQEGRYGVFPTQLPLLLALRLHLSMEALITSYSLGFVLVYGACLWLAHGVFRSPAAALAIMLALLVGVGDSFFHATTETHLLLALSGLLFGAFEQYNRAERKAQPYTAILVIALWCLFTHPNAVFTIGFVTVLALLRGRMRILPLGGVLLLCAVFFLVRIMLMPQGSYDARQYGELEHFSANLTRFWDLFPIWFIQQYLENEYAAVVVLLVVVLIFLRGWPVLLFTLLACTMFWVITILTFHDGSGEAMMEKSFMPGIFMLVLPYAVLCFEHRWGRWFRMGAALLVVHAFVNIMLHARSYSDRLDVLATIMRDNHRSPKILVPMEEAQGTDLHFSEWATSIDALMLSRCIGDTARTVFLRQQQVEATDALTDPHLFLYLPWEPRGAEFLNKRYFDLPAVPYRVVHVQLKPRVGRFSNS